MTQRIWNLIFSSAFSAIVGGIIFVMLLLMVGWESALIEGAAWTYAAFKELEFD